ncbi:MAG: hypothetical protein DDT20_00690 [Firmicutes bacterium]|nr:hypothetical protein [Bacillota bacterium]
MYKRQVPAETVEQKQAREELEASIAPYEMSAEEKSAFEKFKMDFPGEAQAVEARLKAVDRDINARVYKAVQAVLQHIDARVAPIEVSTSVSGQREHFAAIRAAHADYDTVVEKIPEWIKTQPALLRPALQAVYDGGDTKSVIELTALYKAAQTPTPAAVVPAVPAVPAKPAGADDLAPVSTRRATPAPIGARDANDFDGAFEEAAALAAKGL